MQDATAQSELHPPHSGGDVPPITSEPTGPPGLEPAGHDEPTGTLKDAPSVAGTPSPLQRSGPRAQQHTFLPQRGLYYTVIAGVIAGVFTALLTMVVTLVFAGTFHAASQQIAVDKLTVKADRQCFFSNCNFPWQADDVVVPYKMETSMLIGG